MWAHPRVMIRNAWWISLEAGAHAVGWYSEIMNEEIRAMFGDDFETSTLRFKELEIEYEKLKKLHASMLLKRSHHILQKGKCFYIVSDIFNKGTTTFKFGITDDINTRLKSYRTIMVRAHVHLIIYITENKILETLFRIRFQSYLVNKNHEHVIGLELDKIRNYLTKFVKLHRLQVSYASEEKLRCYNDESKSDMHVPDSSSPSSTEYSI